MGSTQNCMENYNIDFGIMRIMITRSIIYFLALLTSFSTLAVDINPFSIPRYSIEYDPSSDPSIDGKNALIYAKQTNRKVLIEVGGDWCQWCHILDEFIVDHPEVKTTLYDHFVILKVNVSEGNKNKEFMSSMPDVDGYPHVYVTDQKGSIKFSGDLSPLLEKSAFSEKLFLEFLNRWK